MVTERTDKEYLRALTGILKMKGAYDPQLVICYESSGILGRVYYNGTTTPFRMKGE
jgi:hypothetical protein